LPATAFDTPVGGLEAENVVLECLIEIDGASEVEPAQIDIPPESVAQERYQIPGLGAAFDFRDGLA